MKVDDASLTVNAEQAAGVVTIAIPYESLDDLKIGHAAVLQFRQGQGGAGRNLFLALFQAGDRGNRTALQPDRHDRL